MNPDTETAMIQKSVEQIFESVEKRIRDLQERQNRGALLVEVIEPLGDEALPETGDMIEVVSSDGKLKQAEVISSNQVLAFHPEFGPVPCASLLVEITDPDRMTLDDFESLYGEEDEPEAAEDLGSACECGADRSDCQQNQELFGLHVNSEYEDE